MLEILRQILSQPYEIQKNANSNVIGIVKILVRTKCSL